MPPSTSSSVGVLISKLARGYDYGITPFIGCTGPGSFHCSGQPPLLFCRGSSCPFHQCGSCTLQRLQHKRRRFQRSRRRRLHGHQRCHQSLRTHLYRAKCVFGDEMGDGWFYGTTSYFNRNSSTLGKWPQPLVNGNREQRKLIQFVCRLRSAILETDKPT